jgi:hypothetical protein
MCNLRLTMGVSVFALLLGTGVATWARDPITPSAIAPSAASARVKQRVEAQVNRRVVEGLRSVKIGTSSELVPAEQLQIKLAPAQAPVNTAVALGNLQSQVSAPSGVPEDSVQSQVPLGLAAIPWGVQHPADVARLVLPVLGTNGANR